MTIRISFEGEIALITLMNKTKKNALTLELVDQLVAGLAQIEASNCRVVILTGSDNIFSAGGDIKEMEAKTGMFSGESNELRENYRRGIQRIPKAIEAFTLPIIAAVNGPAIGAGLDLACMCDLRVAGESALFGETFVKLGLISGDGGGYFLRRLVGYAKAMEMTLTGRMVSAQEAHSMGLVNQVVSDSLLLDRAREMAREIAQNAPIAVRLAKESLKYSDLPLDQYLNVMAAYQGISQRTQDHFEGLKAFKEKRKPDFKGL